MQIGETFRDVKSHRYGWSLQGVRSRTQARVDILLLIAAFATSQFTWSELLLAPQGSIGNYKRIPSADGLRFRHSYSGNLALRFACRFRLTAAQWTELRRELLRMLAEASSI